MKHRDAIIPSVILIALVLGYMTTGLGYSAATRAMPLAVAGLTLALLVVDLLSQGDGRTGRTLRRAFGGAAALRPGSGGERAPLLAELSALAWIAGFTVLAVVLGFYLAIPLYVTAYLRLFARKPLWIALLVGLVLTALLYAVFQMLLGYRIFPGLIFGGYM